MFTEIKILDTVQNKLLNIDKPCSGELYGIKTKDKVTVLGVQFEVNSKCDDSFVCSLPENIQFCGYFEAGTECLEKDKCYEKTRDMNTYPVLFLTVKLDVQNLITAYTVEQFNIHDSLYTLISEQDLYSEFLYLHVSGHLQFRSEATTDAIYESFSRLKDMILERICFSFFKKSMFLYTLCGDTTAVGLSADSTIGELYESSLDETELVVNKKKKSNNSELDVFNVGLIQKNTRETSGTNFDLKKFEKLSHAPVVILDKKHLKVFNTYLPINFLGIIQRKASLKEAHDILIGVVLRHLKLLQLAIQEKIQTGGDNSLSLPETFHFFPQKVGHFVSRVYFKNDTENDLKGQRELLHRQLSLDMSSPKFRRANQFVFKDMLKKNGPLFNPHDGVRPTDNGGHVALVKGKYEYYHYCQNQMDDNGWGCAYRSLQTLASWFIVQGYTKPDSRVPTFQEIQKCLVDIGDKPSNFIGSKQWIGSTEVNFVLDTLFGITSKILFVSSGEEMASKGPELVNHFEMHGSPIMIGGGVLAHTILGVDYNQQTGDIRFLILDPHYTGGEDLKTIQNKGWCGWKKLDFWNKSAYYNMCLPQVPREF